MTPFDRICRLLDARGLPYRHLHHEPTYTSEESARVRGEALAIGAKALVLKVGGVFRLFVLSAATRLDAARVRSKFGVKKTRFATREELQALTGLVPGAVPPFGRPIFDLDLYVDSRLMEQKKVAFNAGTLTDSILMAAADYRQAARPEVFSFASDVA